MGDAQRVWKRQLSAYQEYIDDFTQYVNVIDEKITQVKSLYDSNEREVTAEHETMKTAHGEVKNKLAITQAQLESLGKQKRKTKEELLHVQFQATEVDFQLSQEKRKLLSLQNIKITLESEIASRHARVSELQTNLATLKLYLSRVEKEREMVMTHVNKLRRNLDETRAEAEELMERGRVVPERLEALEQEIELIDREERQAAEELKAAQIALSSFKASEAARSHADREAELVSRENAVIGKRKALESRKNRLGEFTDLNDHRQKRAEVGEEVARLECVLAEKQNELNHLLGN